MRQEQIRNLIECSVVLFIPESKIMYVLNIYLVNIFLSETPVVSGGCSKHGDKCFDKILGIVIPDLLMNLMYCRGFLKNINSAVILKCPKGMLEYYFSKGFTILECNYNNL